MAAIWGKSLLAILLLTDDAWRITHRPRMLSDGVWIFSMKVLRLRQELLSDTLSSSTKIYLKRSCLQTIGAESSSTNPQVDRT